MRKDETTVVAALKEQVADFAKERDWEQFHSLKNLSMALAGEAAELMEPFQWLDGAQSEALMDNPSSRQAVAEEMADVAIYLLQFANRSGIDLTEAIKRKMAKNALKYPVEESKGSSEKRG